MLNTNHSVEQMTTLTESRVGWGEILNRQHAMNLALASLGVWLHAADSLLLATMIPDILADIGGDRLVAWTIATYEIGSIVAGASAAIITMRYGIRFAMGTCALAFAFGCAVSMLAPNMPVLLAGRVLQGLGGGGLVAMTFIAIGVLFSSRLQARVMAVISALWGASAFMGPVVGAFFVEFFDWRWGFGFFLLQAAALALWIFLAPGIRNAPPEDGEPPVMPVRRLVLLTLGATLVASAGIRVAMPQTALLVLAAFASLLLFLRLDAAAGASRMLPRNAFRLNNRAGAALLMWMAMSAGVMGLATYGPVLLSGIHNTPPLIIGYILAGASLGWTFAAITVSGAPERHDGHWIAGGLTLVALSVVGLLFSMGDGPVWVIAALSVAEGLGFGSAYTFVLRQVRAAAPPEELTRVTGALPTVARFGLATGAAVCGILANATGFSADADADTLRHVARSVFAGSLPFIAIGLLGMVAFIAPSHR